MREGRLRIAIPQHAGKFFHPSISIFMNGRNAYLYSGAALVLFDKEMSMALAGNLGQVSNAENLMTFCQSGEFLANDFTDFSPDIGIHFIKNQYRGFIQGGQDGFQSKHYAGEFPAGRDAVELQGGFSDVWSSTAPDGTAAEE